MIIISILTDVFILGSEEHTLTCFLSPDLLHG